MIPWEKKPPLYLVWCSLPISLTRESGFTIFMQRSQNPAKMWVALVEEPQGWGVGVLAHRLSWVEFMSLWLCLCSDSADGLSTVNKAEQSSCLELVQDHVQAFYSRDPSGNHFMQRANQYGQDCPGVGSLMQRPGWTWKQMLRGERESQFSMAIAGKTRRKGFKWSAMSDVLFSLWRKLSQHQG